MRSKCSVCNFCGNHVAAWLHSRNGAFQKTCRSERVSSSRVRGKKSDTVNQCGLLIGRRRQPCRRQPPGRGDDLSRAGSAVIWATGEPPRAAYARPHGSAFSAACSSAASVRRARRRPRRAAAQGRGAARRAAHGHCSFSLTGSAPACVTFIGRSLTSGASVGACPFLGPCARSSSDCCVTNSPRSVREAAQWAMNGKCSRRACTAGGVRMSMCRRRRRAHRQPR